MIQNSRDSFFQAFISFKSLIFFKFYTFTITVPSLFTIKSHTAEYCDIQQGHFATLSRKVEEMKTEGEAEWLFGD